MRAGLWNWFKPRANAFAVVECSAPHCDRQSMSSKRPLDPTHANPSCKQPRGARSQARHDSDEELPADWHRLAPDGFVPCYMYIWKCTACQKLTEFNENYDRIEVYSQRTPCASCNASTHDITVMGKAVFVRPNDAGVLKVSNGHSDKVFPA